MAIYATPHFLNYFISQNEIKKFRSALEEEKQAWINQQNAKLLEKQAAMTAQCKRERDRQIELVIRRLESEASDKEQTLNSRMMYVISPTLYEVTLVFNVILY